MREVIGKHRAKPSHAYNEVLWSDYIMDSTYQGHVNPQSEYVQDYAVHIIFAPSSHYEYYTTWYACDLTEQGSYE